MRDRIREYEGVWLPTANGSDGAFTSMGKRSAISESASKEAESDVAGHFTSIFARAYKERWEPKTKTDLARRAKVSTKTIDRMLEGKAGKLTKEASRLLIAVGVNPDAAARGEYVLMGSTVDQDLHKQLDALLASKHGNTIRLTIESLFLAVAGDDG
jgi:hypothetical protein